MNTNSNPLEKYRELIEHLMRSHMSSFSVNGYLTSILAYSNILHTQITGPVDEQQSEFLNKITDSTNRLSDHLHIFIIASQLMFTPEQIYEGDFNLLETIESFIEQTAKTTEFQIEKEILANPPVLNVDRNLISTSIDCIGKIIKQVHPTYKGWIKLSVAADKDFVKVVFSTNKDEDIYPANENPELFIVQTVAELHGGNFEIVNSDDNIYNFIFTLPIQK
ncbi:MAG: HAMP domain-containing histidine kinase [Anaerolineales bacterium]|nr:HAMP domain-containing histidine kinase [Anaerolineales bacterium]